MPMKSRLSPPVVAGGKVLVSAVDEGTVHALDATDGTPLWSHTVGSRVACPPTVHGELVLFGSADGWVYALRATDGELVWRLRAAPEDRRIVAFGRVESAWPVEGGVLVQDDVAYFAAGRSSYLDGGIHVCSADPSRGEVLSHRCIYSPDPKTGLQPPQSGPQEMPGALSDVLVGSDQGVTMRHLRIDADDRAPSPQGHLLCTAGFLDDSWFNRTNWSLGRVAGQLLVFDDETVYGVRAYSGTGRSGFFFPGKGYELFASDRWAGQEKNDAKAGQKKEATRWTTRVPIRVRAMVLAGEGLCVAGPPDVADADDPWAAFENRRGGVLAVLDAGDGHKVADYKLPAPPVWGGMAAAGGRLFLTTRDGCVVCMGERR
jgi:outer membrane protein assembly factor BamB